MRTLFLFGILFLLVIIAIKKPDQTAWDAVRDFGSIVNTAMSEFGERPEVQVVTGNIRTDVEELIAGSGKELDDEPSSSHSPAMAVDAGEPDGFKGSDLTILADGLSETASVERIEGPQPSTDFATLLPRTDVGDVPNLPAVPLTPVEITEIENDVAPSLVQANPESERRVDYGEVKASYENASRLLAEIE